MRHCFTLLLAAGLSFGWAGQASAKVDFDKQIKPILEKSCVSCHYPGKVKGKLRLDTKPLALKGTPDGPVIVPGKANESSLWERVVLPPDDPDIMPAKGDPLTKAEQDLLRDWINEGATWPDGVTLKTPESTLTPAQLQALKGLPITDAEKAAVSKIEQMGGLAMRIAQNTNWLRADFSLHAKDTKDADLAALKPITNLYELDLAGTKVTDAGLAHLSGAVNLRRLSLAKTSINGSGLGSLKGLQQLHYLNLYGTQVDDKAVAHLGALKGLKKVYLWQTKVTDAGAKKLEAAIPGVSVNTGWKAPPPPKADPAGKKPEPKPQAGKVAIKEVMQKGMKGGLAKKAADGKASPDEVKQLLAYFKSLSEHKPKKGDAKSWKAKTDALVASVTLISKGDAKGRGALQKAMNCKACHNVHK